MIAIDAMGGDYAPASIIEGSLFAAKLGVPVMLCGPEVLIRSHLSLFDPAWRAFPILIGDAAEVIGMAENPVYSVRKKINSSLVQAVMCVKDGRCSGVVSAGNSGAFMAAAVFLLGCSPGVERPAIAGLIPAAHGPVVALDLGAQISCRAQHLVQFAHMGVEYAKKVLACGNPRVGLLANGEEDEKGSVLGKEAFQLLKSEPINFVGNVEPVHVLANVVDVVVTDGFTGNIFLKTIEAIYALNPIPNSIKTTNESLCSIATQMMGVGAQLLGVNGNVIVCHGNSSAVTISKAIQFAYTSSNNEQALSIDTVSASMKTAIR